MAAAEHLALPPAGEELVTVSLFRLAQLAELADAVCSTWTRIACRRRGSGSQVVPYAIACQRIVRAELRDAPPPEVL